MADNKYNEITVLKRLANIQKIHTAFIQKKDVSGFGNKDKIAYILWRDALSRNSDIRLSIEFYKKYFPEYVKNDILCLEDLYNIPKMYDIQRLRAHIQNTEGLFPATDEVRKKRTKREVEFNLRYGGNRRENLKVFSDYYMYLDESGKNEKYFVLAGILLNGEHDNNVQKTRFNNLKEMLNKKHNLNIGEFKFGGIKRSNLDYYKDLIDIIFYEGIPATFVSILVKNKGLNRKNDKNKSKELLEIFLKDCASLIVRATFSSPHASDRAKINIIRDVDIKYDRIGREKIKQDINGELKKTFEHFIKVDTLSDVDSKDNIFVQLSDLYAGSINNVFSEQPDDSETAKCKKEFAKYFLEKVGLEDITQESSSNKSSVRFINKVII